MEIGIIYRVDRLNVPLAEEALRKSPFTDELRLARALVSASPGRVKRSSDFTTAATVSLVVSAIFWIARTQCDVGNALRPCLA